MKDRMGTSCGRMSAGRIPRSVLALLLALLFSFGWMPGAAFAEEDGSQYIFGKSTEYSTFSAGEELTDSFYYTDDWFSQDPAGRNDELALVSMQAVAAGAEESADGRGGAFLRGLGFENVAFAGSGLSDPDACNYLYGTKTVSDGSGSYTLVAVVIQSYTFDPSVKEQGWRQNFTVNDKNAESQGSEHFGFALAADKVTPAIEGLGGSGNKKYWIMGQSRGGALTNLIAKRLGDAGHTVYAYTFEAPATTENGGGYGYIHNYLCRDDIVTKIPMWGMTRYGNTYEIRDETDEQVMAELEKLGSGAVVEEYPPDAEWLETDIVDYLSERVPERADYSVQRTDTFTDADTGDAVSLTYSYQDTFVGLMSVLFSGELTGAADVILNNIEEVAPAVYALAEAVKQDGDAAADPYYWQAAKGLHAVLDAVSEQPFSLSEKDLYALLKLVGPFAVDMDYEPQDIPIVDALGYLSPVISIGASAGGMTFSHQFDTVIARLKVLAPQPELDDVDIEIKEPEAGDPADKAPSEVAAFFDDDAYKDANGDSWLTASAAWDTDDTVLQDDYVYYLNVTLETVGHTIPEDLALKVNGNAPVSGPFITYDEATGVTRATFEFEIGEPPELTVSFDTAGKTEDPAAITVKRGTALSTQERPAIEDPVTQNGDKYKLQDWYDENGTAWDDVKVDEPLTMHAKWLLLVDRIELSFTVPSLGEAIPEVTVPEDAPYYICLLDCADPNWNTVTEAEEEGEYHYSIYVSLKDLENSVFALEDEEWGGQTYTGTVTMNGEEVSSDWPDEEELYYRLDTLYDEDGPYVCITYEFPVTDEESAEEALYTFVEGDDTFWVKGSGEPLRFVVKRSEDDASTFDHFTGIEVDGETVAEDAYTAEAGSVILDLKPSYLESLSEDTHKLTVQFDDGTAEATFKVAASETTPGGKPDRTAPDEKAGGRSAKTAKTGDDSRPVLWAAICGGSLLTLLLLAYAGRRRSIK